MQIIDWLSTALDLVLRLLLPQRCLSCRKLGEIICKECLSKLPKESNPYGITTFFSYSDKTIEKAIWLLKYKGVREIAKPLAKVAHERLLEDLSSLAELSPGSDKRVVIVPVPLSKARERERGFNQSVLLAKEIVKLDNSRSFDLRTDVLKKIKNTPSQVSIKDRTKRLKNLNKVFVIGNKAEIKDRIVVLLDDVTTTGTTLNECAKILRRAKPRHIVKVAIAH